MGRLKTFPQFLIQTHIVDNIASLYPYRLHTLGECFLISMCVSPVPFLTCQGDPRAPIQVLISTHIVKRLLHSQDVFRHMNPSKIQNPKTPNSSTLPHAISSCEFIPRGSELSISMPSQVCLPQWLKFELHFTRPSLIEDEEIARQTQGLMFPYPFGQLRSQPGILQRSYGSAKKFHIVKPLITGSQGSQCLNQSLNLRASVSIILIKSQI